MEIPNFINDFMDNENTTLITILGTPDLNIFVTLLRGNLLWYMY